MNKLTPARRAAVLTALVEGNSILSTVRMTGERRTQFSGCWLTRESGCDYQNGALRNLPSRRVQCD
ncbi:MAG: hypothetical protein ABI779_12180 [Acidobacteriota bacterium]